MKNFLSKIKKSRKGSIILEMLIAMAIIVTTIASVIMLVFSGQSSTIGSQTNQEALYKAQKQIEDARAQARADFSSVVSIPTQPDDIYSKSTIVTTSADGL